MSKHFHTHQPLSETREAASVLHGAFRMLKSMDPTTGQVIRHYTEGDRMCQSGEVIPNGTPFTPLSAGCYNQGMREADYYTVSLQGGREVTFLAICDSGKWRLATLMEVNTPA